MKNIHPSTSSCTYKCVTCQKEFIIETVGSTKEVPVEVCSNCHSFYIGKQSTGTTLRGRAEKLSSKFETGLNNVNKKPEKKEVVRKSKPRQGLSAL